MFSAYTTLFRTPGGMKFSIAGFIGRMPISMEGLALIFVVVAASDSYALAGLLSAIAEITKSIATPFWSRQADRYGQRKILNLIVPLRTLLMTIFIVCAVTSTPVWTWFLTIILAELTTINAGGMVRIRWLYVLNKNNADHHLVNTAYSYESLIDEFVFIFGPMLATLCATSIHPAAGMVAALVFFCTGLPALASLKNTEPPPSPRINDEPHPPVLRNKVVRAVAIPAAIVGGFFSSMGLCVVSFSEVRNAQSQTGILLAIWAGGSAVSAIITGTIKWKSAPAMRYVINLAVLSLLAIPFLFVKSIPFLALALFINGLSIAPIIINAYAIVEKAVPSAQLTETLAWVTAGMPIGGATASALAGWIIDNHGTETAFWVPLGFTLAALCATLAHFTTYRPLISYPQHRD